MSGPQIIPPGTFRSGDTHEMSRVAPADSEPPASDADDANAMAAMLAAYLDGHAIQLADLPLSARRRITAYRHQRGAGRLGARGVDQHGPLPDVPPIETTQRAKPGVIELTAVEDQNHG